MSRAIFSLFLLSSLAEAKVTSPSFYLLCERSTSIELDSKSTLSCDDSLCLDLSLPLEVKADPMTGSLVESCRLLRTESPLSMTDGVQSFVPYVERSGQEPVIGAIQAPGMGRLYPGESFIVEFPAEGSYRFELTRARGSMRFLENNP